MIKKILAITISLAFLIIPRQAMALNRNTYVTVSNQVRGWEDWNLKTQSPLDLPKFQYQESTPSALPITWLLRYDVTTDATLSGYFSALTKKDKTQSLGAFFEITPSLIKDSNVNIEPGASGYLYLSHFTTQDRVRLIDTYMNSFFAQFGNYPKSVSAQYLDSFSLQYFQQKYSVLTALTQGEIFGVTNPKVRGGYVGSPYFPDKNNSLIPASSLDNRINLTMISWTQTDIFNQIISRGYVNRNTEIENYISPIQNLKALQSLITTYTQKDFNEITQVNFGQENDQNLQLLKKPIKSFYSYLSQNPGNSNFKTMSLSDFGDWYKARFPESTPAYLYTFTDPNKFSQGKVLWYQTPFYRIGLQSKEGKTVIVDLRVYNRNLYEEYISTPNQTSITNIEIPYIVDSLVNPGSSITLDFDLENAKSVYNSALDFWSYTITDNQKTLILNPKEIIFKNFSVVSPNTKDLQIIKTKSDTTWKVSPYTPYQENLLLKIIVVAIAILLIAFLVIKKKRQTKLPIIIGIISLSIASLTVINNGTLHSYGMGFWGPNGHDAIFHLSVIEKFSKNLQTFNHPQISGEKLANYHFVFDYLSGIIVKVTHIPATVLYFQISPIVIGGLILFLLNKLLDQWGYSTKEKKLAFVLAFLAGSFGFIPKIILGQDFTTGESIFWANQSVSIFLNPPFALSVLFLLWFLSLLNKPKDHWLHFLFLIILGGLLAQTKIYAYALLLGALFLAKKYKLFLGVLVVGILISLPFSSLSGFPFVFSPFWFVKSVFASQDRVYWPRLVEAWQSYEASGNFIKLSIVNLFAVSVFIVGNLGIRTIGLTEVFSKAKEGDTEKITKLLALIGIVTPLIIIQAINPWNTIQFLYYSLFFLSPFTAKAIVNFVKKLRWQPLKFIFVFVVISISCLTSVGTLKDYMSSYSSSRVGYSELRALDALRSFPEGIVLSPMISDASRTIANPKPLYSYVSTAYISALSGKSEYLSDTINLDITGFRYQERAKNVQRFYNTLDKDWAKSFLADNNISFVYENPLTRLTLSPSDICLKPVFVSATTNIYQYNCNDQK